jgi:hypothetical protein
MLPGNIVLYRYNKYISISNDILPYHMLSFYRYKLTSRTLILGKRMVFRKAKKAVITLSTFQSDQDWDQPTQNNYVNSLHECET